MTSILINSEDQHLVDTCKGYLDALSVAEQWIHDNAELVSASSDSLLREASSLARALRKETSTAARKMCVGVFGPSQSGKSYLISTLAQDSNGALCAVFGNEVHDFIQDINPAGGKESTGLVTRFTLSPPHCVSKSQPVCLRLLSELDLVKILANTYYADCQHSDPLDEESMLARLADLAKVQDSQWLAPFSEDDIVDLHEYMTRNFRASALVQKMENLYWPRARQLAGRLALADRAQLFELLWDKAKPFTALYLRLCTVLDALGHADEAFCGQDALIPREKSIIDVATLEGLGEAGQDTLNVTTAHGYCIQAQRAEIAALTAELTITMQNKPDDFFEYTDLLDFPGYRSRLKTNDIARELAKEDQLRQFFLRGKVAYLFERYKRDLELTSMLLCIGPSNQEVQDLPAVINDWISDAHGARPELREGKQNTLFLVLTKFDMEFEKKKGALDDETRWSNRLHSSLLDFLGKQYEWPRIWTPQQCFKNLYWLRNPKFHWEAVINFDGDCETGIRQEQMAYVADMKQKFLRTPEVRAHFSDPEAAWNAAMTLNDGGVAYLRAHLRPVCDPAIKREQVRNRVQLKLQAFTEKLQRFHKTDDKQAQREQQQKLGHSLAEALAQTAQNQHFGELLQSLTMRDYDLYTLYYQVEACLLQNSNNENTRAQTQVSIGNAASAQSILNDLFGDELEVDSTDNAPGCAPKSEEEAFAELVINAWIERMNTVASDSTRQKYFGISAELFGQFVHELVQGMTRLKLPQQMVEAIRTVSQYRNMRHDKIVWRQASIAAHTINTFINWLGFDPNILPEHQRILHMRGKARTLFVQPADVLDYPQLPQEPVLVEQLYYTDWLLAFLNVLEANVDSEDGMRFNPEENARLEKLILALTPRVIP